MKHIALLLSLTSTLFLQTQASEDVEKTLKSKITNVTVFMQGAQVTRTGSTSIPKGTSTIIFEGVSPLHQSTKYKGFRQREVYYS